MLHILTGPGCNNNCLFCMEADRAGRDAYVRAQSDDDVRAMIEACPRDQDVLFTSGEPTLHPRLADFVRMASARGLRSVGLITNGRRFAYRAFGEHLVAAGLDRVTVSIHGHEAGLHDALTRTPGSFAQTLAGLENLSRTASRRSLTLHTSTVLNRRNLPRLADILVLLRGMPIQQKVFNVVMARGRGALHFAALMPRYSEVIEAFCNLPEELADGARVVDLPRCLLARLPERLRGEVETFSQFEPVGSTGVAEISLLNAASDTREASQRAAASDGGGQLAVEHLDEEWEDLHRPWWEPPWLSKRLREVRARVLPSPRTRERRAVDETLSQLGERIGATTDLCGAQPYYLAQRELKDGYLRRKGPPCDRCARRASCAGVWGPYVQEWGWAEFTPIAP
ncbi:MAG TPA: radical SAM protein [Polyangiaceae bacterium]|nr:radical SAM protein [Polyangiaceae bacterium]